jgi:hypothetical protein
MPCSPHAILHVCLVTRDRLTSPLNRILPAQYRTRTAPSGPARPPFLSWSAALPSGLPVPKRHSIPIASVLPQTPAASFKSPYRKRFGSQRTSSPRLSSAEAFPIKASDYAATWNGVILRRFRRLLQSIPLSRSRSSPTRFAGIGGFFAILARRCTAGPARGFLDHTSGENSCASAFRGAA